MSRHRGAKRSRRYGLSETISLLSPAYLLFVERWLFRTKPPDHYDRLSSLFDMYILQLSNYIPLRSKIKILFEIAFVRLRYSLGGDRPSQTTSHKLSFIKNSVYLKIVRGISLAPKLPRILHAIKKYTT